MERGVREAITTEGKGGRRDEEAEVRSRRGRTTKRLGCEVRVGEWRTSGLARRD